jgi:hypothetical protein
LPSFKCSVRRTEDDGINPKEVIGECWLHSSNAQSTRTLPKGGGPTHQCDNRALASFCYCSSVPFQVWQ